MSDVLLLASQESLSSSPNGLFPNRARLADGEDNNASKSGHAETRRLLPDLVIYYVPKLAFTQQQPTALYPDRGVDHDDHSLALDIIPSSIHSIVTLLPPSQRPPAARSACTSFLLTIRIDSSTRQRKRNPSIPSTARPVTPLRSFVQQHTSHPRLQHTLSITTHPYPGRHLRDSTSSSGRTNHAFPITLLGQTRRRTGRVE